MTKPFKLAEKAIRRLNATWNSVKQRAVAGIGASAVVWSRVACGFCTCTTTCDSAYRPHAPDLMHG